MKNGFSINVYDTTGSAVLVPGALDVRPQAWSAIARGGMWDAEIAIGGPLQELVGLTSWLGYRLEIINSHGVAVWWGDVQTVEVVSGGLRRGVSLDRLANRCSVRYSEIQPGGMTVAADTAWADDATSQSKFGIWERRVSPSRDMSSTEATTLRATAIAMLASPHYTLGADNGEVEARIYCTGVWQRLKRRYYSHASGLEEHNVSGTSAVLGQGFTSTKVAFATNNDTIHAIDGQFASFESGRKIRVSGSASNNGSFDVTAADGRTPFAYQQNTISFSPADDIADSINGLSYLATDDVVTISGSAANSGTHQIAKTGSHAIEISTGFLGRSIVTEAAGPIITITRGNSISVGSNLTIEHVGSSVTVTVWGQRYYQSFSLAANLTWTVATIELRLRKVGSPGDGITVQLVLDSSGSPGTVIESVTVAAASIPAETGWVAFSFTNVNSIAYGTTYGLVVMRSGANHESNYYEIDTDTDLGYSRGAMKAYDGAAYQTPSPAADMIFRILGALDSGTQAALILGSQSGWPARMTTPTSGVVSNQYRTGELTAYAEMESLLDMGTSNGLRILAKVARDLAAFVYTKPASGEVRFALQDGARLTDLFGQDTEPGFLPAGEWVRLGDTSELGPWATLSPLFVERADYQVGAGLSIEPEGDTGAFDLGVSDG